MLGTPLNRVAYRTKTGPASLRGAKIDCIDTFVPFGGPDPILLMPTRKDAAKLPLDPVNITKNMTINMREKAGAHARAREREGERLTLPTHLILQKLAAVEEGWDGSMVPGKSISALFKKLMYASATDCVNPETLKTAHEVRFFVVAVSLQ